MDGAAPREIACDESGAEGENLTDGNTDVFTHAGVRLDAADAADCLAEMRRRIRSPATEYKANHLLREKHRAVLVWLLGPDGPIHGRARVHLIDKSFFLLGRLVDVLVGASIPAPGVGPGTDPGLAALATTIHRDGRLGTDAGRWRRFETAANELLRYRNRPDEPDPADAFVAALDALRAAGTSDELAAGLGLLRAGIPHAAEFRAELVASPALVPALDPFVPGVIRTVVAWLRDIDALSVAHDRQTTLTDERIAVIRAAADAASPGHRLGGFRLVGSFDDPRIQIADFLAGTARRIASDALNGRGDPELTTLLRPYVDPCSSWSDRASWSLLAPGARSATG